MSKVVKKFATALFENGWFRKLFNNHTPGSRIAPPQSGNNDASHQLRIDAGEVINGQKYLYLQVNSQATSDSLKKFIAKEGTHANLATVSIDINTAVEKQEEVAEAAMAEIKEQAKANL
ncbi:MAG: hypothetical protein Q9216_002351 [Gyalolechia sp. 2 TL-2023]